MKHKVFIFNQPATQLTRSEECCASGSVHACVRVCVSTLSLHPCFILSHLNVNTEKYSLVVLRHQQLLHVRLKMESEEIAGDAERLIYGNRGACFSPAAMMGDISGRRAPALYQRRHKEGLHRSLAPAFPLCSSFCAPSEML